MIIHVNHLTVLQKFLLNLMPLVLMVQSLLILAFFFFLLQVTGAALLSEKETYVRWKSINKRNHLIIKTQKKSTKLRNKHTHWYPHNHLMSFVLYMYYLTQKLKKARNKQLPLRSCCVTERERENMTHLMYLMCISYCREIRLPWPRGKLLHYEPSVTSFKSHCWHVFFFP